MKLISLPVMLLVVLLTTLNVKSVHAQATPTPTPTPAAAESDNLIQTNLHSTILAEDRRSVALCGTIAAMVSIGDLADRAPRALADGELVSLGKHQVRWLDAPHLPHAWECGFMMEERTSTLLCGDLFTQSGADCPAITESDILAAADSGLRRKLRGRSAKPKRSMPWTSPGGS